MSDQTPTEQARDEAILELVKELCEWQCTWREYRDARRRADLELFLESGPCLVIDGVS